jgi:hypothetical protein
MNPNELKDQFKNLNKRYSDQLQLVERVTGKKAKSTRLGGAPSEQENGNMNQDLSTVGGGLFGR